MLSMIHYVVYWYTVKRERYARQIVCVCVCMCVFVYDALVSTAEGATYVRERACRLFAFFSQLTFCAPGKRTCCARETVARGKGPLCVHIYMCEGVYGGMCNVIIMAY